MKISLPVSLYLRILLVSLFVTLIGLAPFPKTAVGFMLAAHRSIAANDNTGAATDLANLARIFPWRYDLNSTAARYAYQAGDFRAAIQYFERPGTVSSLSNEDLLMLGDAYLKSGNSLMAAAIWKHLIELGSPLPATQRLADLYLQEKDYATAASYFQQLLFLDPSRVHLYYQVGELYAVNDPIKALPFLTQAAELDSKDAAQAKTLYDKIRTANLFDEPAYTSLIVGRQLANFGEWALASRAFQHAISLRSDYADAWAFLGEAKQQISLQETGAVADIGRPELELALQIDGSSVLANTLFGLYWERQEDYSQAATYLRKAISLSPQDPFLYTELGNIFSKAGDLPTAQVAYESAIQQQPQDPLFYRLLAQFALDNNIQIRELALPAIRQALLIDPQDSKSLDMMAEVMLALLDYRSAERYAQQAVQADPSYAPAYLHLGTAYLYQGKSEQAFYWLSQTQAVDPGSWVAGQATRMLDYYFPK